MLRCRAQQMHRRSQWLVGSSWMLNGADVYRTRKPVARDTQWGRARHVVPQSRRKASRGTRSNTNLLNRLLTESACPWFDHVLFQVPIHNNHTQCADLAIGLASKEPRHTDVCRSGSCGGPD